MHLSHAITLTYGSYITYVFVVNQGFPLFISIIFSVFFGIALMLLVNQFLYRPLQKRNVENWQILIASLGIYVVLQNVISLIWGDRMLSFRNWPIQEGHQFAGAYITTVQITTIVVSLGFFMLIWLFLVKTTIGQNIKAITSNSQLASLLGISKNKTIKWSFIIGSGLGAIAGILIASDIDMTPTMGFNWLLYGVVAMIIGGTGKMGYLLFGALLLATSQQLAAYYLDSKWMNTTAYIILIIFLYFRPYGFSGQALKKAEL